MRKIIVHTGYVPYSVLRKSTTLTPKGVQLSFVTLIPEIKKVHGVNKLLDSLNDGNVLELATNDVIEAYAIRAYVVQHADDYDVEYRYYTQDDYKLDNPSKYKTIKQGEHGDFINPPEGFFDTIDNLLNQRLGLD